MRPGSAGVSAPCLTLPGPCAKRSITIMDGRLRARLRLQNGSVPLCLLAQLFIGESDQESTLPTGPQVSPDGRVRDPRPGANRAIRRARGFPHPDRAPYQQCRAGNTRTACDAVFVALWLPLARFSSAPSWPHIDDEAFDHRTPANNLRGPPFAPIRCRGKRVSGVKQRDEPGKAAPFR